jgi:hypothetical protein
LTQEILNACAAVAAVVDNVSGINKVPSVPMENINEYPFALVYPANGNINIGPVGTRKSLNNIHIDLLTVRRDINLDLTLMIPFIDSVSAALNAEISYDGDRFSGTVQTFENILYEFLPFYPYAGPEMIGYRFIMENVKILVNL